MPRRLRVSTGGYAYHVLNRGVGKLRLFAKRRDFEAFEEVIAQAKQVVADASAGVVRGSPFGDAEWQQRTAKHLGLESTLRPRGRPWPSTSETEQRLQPP